MSDLVRQLATFAFEDYSRSAASVKQCDGCNEEGFIDAEVFIMKSHTPAREKRFVKMSLNMGIEDIRPSEYEVRRQVREGTRVLSPQCKGKKVVSCACNFCSNDGLSPSFKALRLNPWGLLLYKKHILKTHQSE